MSCLLDILRSSGSGIIEKWKCSGTAAAQPRIRRSCKVREQAHKAEELQTSTAIFIYHKTVWREIHGMGSHGRAALSKPHIIKYKRQI